MRSLLVVIAVVAIACGTGGAHPARPAGTAAASSGGEGGATDLTLGGSGGLSIDMAPELEGVCGLATGPGLLPCDESVTNRAACDGQVSACRTDQTEPVRYVCMNLGDGRPSGWTTVHAIETPCEDRAEACPELSGETAQQAVGHQIQALLNGCLGNESGVTVALADGCATDFVLSSDDPHKIACMAEALGTRRFSCATEVTCSGASLSTLR